MSKKMWFKLTRLSRDDVEAQGYNQEALSDDDMERLASHMVTVWLESGLYWDCIDEFCTSEKGLAKSDPNINDLEARPLQLPHL